MKLKNKSGFTILEIIIVIIIVGVLASLALPRFFDTVEFSRSTEALNSLSTIRQSMERCSMFRNNDYSNCNDLDMLDIEDPTDVAGALFSYSLSGTSTVGYTITATRNTTEGGDGSSTIALDFDNTTTPAVTRVGTGVFEAIN